MNTVKRLLPFLYIILAVSIAGCSHTDKKEAKEAITKELDLLKNLDSETTQKYVSYKELFPDAAENTEYSDEVNEVFSLFFQNFNYKILDINVDKEKNTASASIRLFTLDAHELARDYAAARLEADIRDDADKTENTNDTTLSLEERYLLLHELLTANDYGTVEDNCTISLTRKEGIWEINRSYSLENDLVGGLITDLSDPDILSPAETLEVYLNTLQEMDLDEMSSYLGIESILDDGDTAKNALAEALVEQVHKNFNYNILESTINGYQATVPVEITTFDSNAILTAYQARLDTYLDSADAVIDGSAKRYQTSYDLLLEAIESNEETTTSTATLSLINDGVSWKLQDPSLELGNAIFGNLTTSPVTE
jgi:uncharacterized membrane protein